MSGPVPEAQQRTQPHQEVGMMIQANGLGRAVPGSTRPGAEPRLHSLLEGRGLLVLEAPAPSTPSNRRGARSHWQPGKLSLLVELGGKRNPAAGAKSGIACSFLETVPKCWGASGPSGKQAEMRVLSTCLQTPGFGSRGGPGICVW